MSGGLELDFSDAEFFEAFRLVSSDAEARRHLTAVRRELRPGMDWSMSHDLLLLLSIAIPTGRERAERIRKVGQGSRLAASIRAAPGGFALSDEEVMLRVRDAVAKEDLRWQQERAERRRMLLKEGKRLPDES